MHGACACCGRVRSIRFDQGIGAIDREAGLPSAGARRADPAPRRSDADHRFSGDHLRRRLRPGDRPEPAAIRLGKKGSDRARRSRLPTGSNARNRRVKSVRPPPNVFRPLLPGLIPSWGIAAGRHVLRRRRRRPHPRPHAREPAAPIADQAADILAGAEPLLTPASRAGAAEVRLPNGASALAALRPIKPTSLQLIVVQELPSVLAAATGCAVDHAVGDHRLRRADPRLRLPLAVDTRARRRPDQRRRARPDRHRAQSRPLRTYGTGTFRAAVSSGRSRCSRCWGWKAAATC